MHLPIVLAHALSLLLMRLAGRGHPLLTLKPDPCLFYAPPRLTGIAREPGTGIPAIVMRYYSRGSLKDVLDDMDATALPLSTRLNMARDVARGMAYLHDRPNEMVRGAVGGAESMLDKVWGKAGCGEWRGSECRRRGPTGRGCRPSLGKAMRPECGLSGEVGKQSGAVCGAVRVRRETGRRRGVQGRTMEAQGGMSLLCRAVYVEALHAG